MSAPNVHLLRTRLRRTWPAFFARHGNFTAVQQAAIPPILHGQNTLVIAATASGKTEAAIAPLLEQLSRPSPQAQKGQKRNRGEKSLQILYICPTRALVRDIYERLRAPLAALDVSLAMKSGDTGPVSTQNPPAVLITTPESTDSLLTRAPRLLTRLRAVVLDEIHLFDGGPRGDHLRCLLRRIEIVRSYHQQQTGSPAIRLQRVALSATVPAPHSVAQRYLAPEIAAETGSVAVVQVPGKRQLDATVAPMDDLHDLAQILGQRSTSTANIRKTLIFCNSRNEVEQTAAFLRSHLGFSAAVFAHYSNLDPALRLEVENEFAATPVAVCVSTSTLELGIDIGSIDDVALIGPPPSLQSFLQRIGRGGRRTGITRVLCLARSPREEVQFQALLRQAEAPTDPTRPEQADSEAEIFLPSVLVQQTFSILKQSPTGAIRLGDLRRVSPVPSADETLHSILRHLARLDFLRSGRLGEWRAGPALDELVDAHEIYSNIGRDPLALVLVDAFSGRTLAQTDRRREVGEILRLGGHPLRVVWQDRYRIGVERLAAGPASGPPDEALHFHSAPFALPYEMGQAVAEWIGLQPGQVAAVPVAEGVWLFHFWGELYGELLREILAFHAPESPEAAPLTTVDEHCLFVPGQMDRLPPWDERLAQRGLMRLLPRLEAILELGRFHSLLPPDVAQKTVIARCNLPRFARLYQTAQVTVPAPRLQARLELLIA